MSEADLYLGNDSGITHLAAACGTLYQLLFSVLLDPQVWGPQGPQVSIIRWQPGSSFDEQAELRKISEPPLEAELVCTKAREWLQI